MGLLTTSSGHSFAHLSNSLTVASSHSSEHFDRIQQVGVVSKTVSDKTPSDTFFKESYQVQSYKLAGVGSSFLFLRLIKF